MGKLRYNSLRRILIERLPFHHTFSRSTARPKRIPPDSRVRRWMGVRRIKLQHVHTSTLRNDSLQCTARLVKLAVPLTAE